MALNSPCCCLLLFCLAIAAAIGARSESTDDLGFITIDCGLAPGSSYVDPRTNISYVSDDGFIDTGVNRNISGAYVVPNMVRRLQTVRSFPNGTRNCYAVKPVMKGAKYLLRAWFMYGNYDGLNTKPLAFDLHLGVNLWARVNIEDPAYFYHMDAIAVASADFFSVCLVNTGSGTPIISTLEARPLKDKLYPQANASRALVLFKRVNLGFDGNYIRYPDDRLDRGWESWTNSLLWTDISTNSAVDNLAEDSFEAPTSVMQTAVTPVNSSVLYVSWDADPNDVNQYFAIVHISELVNLPSANASRQFDINANGFRWLTNSMRPDYLSSDNVYSLNPFPPLKTYNITLQALSNSTLPPLLNALEIYSTMSTANVPSDVGDVDAMMSIKDWYQIKRNWMGDPCAPVAFSWNGLNCTFTHSDPPRITVLNLSSSGLTGEITTSFGNLDAIEYLDLSYNNLTGVIPIALAKLSSLKFLDLTSNQLSGSVPSSLLEKSQNGFLTLRLEGNPHLCESGTSCTIASTKKKIPTPEIVILSIVPVVILLLVMVILWRMRKLKGTTLNPLGFIKQEKKQCHDSLQLENRQFTYRELKNITNNFQKVLGKGGFGAVYHGYLEDGTQVAVKMRNELSAQGKKEFTAEVIEYQVFNILHCVMSNVGFEAGGNVCLIGPKHLTKVHHRNLVSLVGYCNDKNRLALVYEFMPQGTLEDHLRGRTDHARVLTWGLRLRIALEVAQGLEYLHKGCKPPLIHRDVKTANILLSERLEAKIADFGLSKPFQSEINTHISTAVVGTPGYLDPEYYATFQLSEKSDVYSFGVVLLELITGLPPIIHDTEHVHIVQRVLQRLSRGNIEDIVDAKLKGNYGVNSVWKCANIALQCTSQGTHQRPTMIDVVMQLKECLELERSHDSTENLVTCSENLNTEISDLSQNSSHEIEDVARMSEIYYCPSSR